MTETHRVEYKQKLTDGLEKEVVAFLNYSIGGSVILGLDRDQIVLGLADADGDSLKIKDRLKHKISPSVLGLFDIQVLKEDGKDIIKIIVASGPEKPYFISKYGMTSRGCFLRVGTASEPMPQPMIDELFATRTRHSLSKIKSEKQDLSFSQLRIYYDEKDKTLNDQFTHNLELLSKDGSYNYNGYLLSDVNVSSFKLAVYEGRDRGQLLSAEEYGNTCIITAAKKLFDRLDVENRTHSEIDGDRVDTRLWNQEALREAVRNAFVHNDYSRESFPKFEIFSDRIEITSAGGLPEGLSQEEFFLGYSAPRNKVLMRIFRDVGLVESLGIGIPKILETYNRDCFEFTDHFLRMKFFKEVSEETVTSNNGDGGAQEELQISGLTDRQKDVYLLIMANPKITRQDLADALSINPSAVQKHIDAIKELGLIERKGGTRGAWAAIDQLD